MKRYILFSIALLALSTASAQSAVDQILQSVAEHNNGIKAVSEQATADKATLSAANSLDNLSFDFDYLWGEKGIPAENRYGFTVKQGFDFPSLYVQRRKLIDAQGALGDMQVDFARQTTLLQARELCINIVYLNRQIAIVSERVAIADTLVALYNRRLQAGDANRIEVNKIELEHLSQSTRLKMLQSERQALIASLVACNGGGELPVSIDALTDYPVLASPSSVQEVIDAWLQNDASMQLVRQQVEVAGVQTAVSRQGWIPAFDLGYKQVYEGGQMFYGLVVGVSLPLYKTGNEVKAQRAQALSLSLQADDATAQITAEATRIYEEVMTLQTALGDYALLDRQDNARLLLKALQNGQISLLEYMADMAQLNEVNENRLLLEYQYHSKLSQLHRNSL